VKELVPTGKLRFGVAFAPKMSALFVIKQADGTPRGITADLGRALAKKHGVPVEFLVAPNTGVLTDALANAEIDVAFMPVDEERKQRLDFGPAYCSVESTYMVMPASGIKTLAEVDRPGIRVVGVANTTTIRAAGRTLKHTQPIAATSIAVPKGRSGALAYVTEFMREAKASGAVRRAMDRAGMSDLAVAP
jgi:polar amino acid transport system substrate-binding protein